jgi:hypothetical protein
MSGRDTGEAEERAVGLAWAVNGEGFAPARPEGTSRPAR